MREFDKQERLRLWAAIGTEYFAGRYDQLEGYYPDLEEAFLLAKARRREMLDFLPERTVGRLCVAAEDGYIESLLERLQKQGIEICLRGDEGYPPLLRAIAVPPSLLYYRGRIPGEGTLNIAVVGSRKPSAYGLEMAGVFALGLARGGAVIVSGMAAGVDAAAAKAALNGSDGACPTVAVLGSGVDVVYPAENRRLYEQIVERGAVISEFFPGVKPERGNFPIRNRIISGMSRGVVVVEAAERSGTSITAGYALEEGREVFSIPGRITDKLSAGTNRMIQRGEAKAVFCPDDVLSEFGVSSPGKPAEEQACTLPLSTLSPVEGRIWRLLSKGDKTVDELCEALGLPVGSVNSALTAMMFSGIMKQLPGRVYTIEATGVIITDDTINGGTGFNG